MAKKDYYQILGIDEDADDAKIKRVYRKLAKEYHPDAHPGNKRAEARFKEISEAYNVLSNPQKRKRYNQMRRFGFARQPGGFNRPGFDFDLNDILGSSLRGKHRRQRSGEFNIDDFLGFGGLGELFTHIFDKQSGFQNQNNNPNDINTTLEIPFETAVLGGKTAFNVPGENSKQLSVKIAPGTENGKKLCFPLHGRESANGLPRGDLIVTLKVKKHRFFKVDGSDIHCEIPISSRMAQNGTKLRVKTIHGTVVEITIPPNTKHGKTFRLKEMGIKSNEKQGDQLVTITLK